MIVDVSRHAVKRLAKRLDLPVEDVSGHAQQAWTDGVVAQEHPDPIRSVYWTGEQRRNLRVMYVLYGQMVYVFGLTQDRKRPALVTVMPDRSLNIAKRYSRKR